MRTERPGDIVAGSGIHLESLRLFTLLKNSRLEDRNERPRDGQQEEQYGRCRHYFHAHREFQQQQTRPTKEAW